MEQPRGDAAPESQETAPSDCVCNDEEVSQRTPWDSRTPWYYAAVLWLVQLGCVPSHVAVMPDGNRRFAQRTGTDLRRTYIAGTLLFSGACRWCFEAGVSRVTVFVFALRHMRRCTFEKTALLLATVDTWADSLRTLGHIDNLNMRMMCVGQIELLPIEQQIKLAELEVATSHGQRSHICLVCTGYSSKHQMARAALHLAKAVKAATITTEDVTAELLDAYIAHTECPDVDMLMLCAGPRFSDFMVMQCSYAYLHITPKMWPEVDFWEWICAFLMYQLHWCDISTAKEKHRALEAIRRGLPDPERALRQQIFIKSVTAAGTEAFGHSGAHLKN
ncbi:dehydrodolichyl diphosphate synthase complex subunit Dhdds-like isoform X2 [Dermacentor silvarum]|uniref:dehydrodolichyl diphosphate synthase complex subunit Dhdds-like isoform X2 n=1 Tax=Dermacentor silvarum TaxID=543639 RepID=UPI002100A09E|nr:dehydrodolichyl diphosphate synthase complex subunit Dhdds-like isoform X2 [Dermacentor silvarum]